MVLIQPRFELIQFPPLSDSKESHPLPLRDPALEQPTKPSESCHHSHPNFDFYLAIRKVCAAFMDDLPPALFKKIEITPAQRLFSKGISKGTLSYALCLQIHIKSHRMSHTTFPLFCLPNRQGHIHKNGKRSISFPCLRLTCSRKA